MVAPGQGSGMSGISQDPRLLTLSGGVPELVPRHLTVREALSRPYLIEVEAFSHEINITPAQAIGKDITVTVQPGFTGMAARKFHGVVRGITRLGDNDRGYTAYRLEAVPKMWMLSRTQDCRIFENKTLKQIIEALFSDNNLPAPQCTGLPSDPRIYCTQYMETDLDFLQRILDESGATYYFDHSGGVEVLKIIDGAGTFPSIGSAVASDVGEVEGKLTKWQPTGAMIPSKVVAHDHDNKSKAPNYERTAPTNLTPAKADNWEMFLWGGQQDNRGSDGVINAPSNAHIARVAMETAEAMADTFTTVVRDPKYYAGGKVTVTGGDGASSICLIQATTHIAYDDSHLTSGGTSGYQAELRLSPADRPFRNPTPRARPVMAGVFSAKVVGEGVVETDEMGRIKVHMRWNRPGEGTNSQFWVRVMQPFAGAWGGTWFLPRVDDEVIIAFMNADPDVPICIGSVYNNDAKPPFALPDNKTQSGFSTRTHDGQGQNILRTDDKSGAEEFYFQAEKDMKVLVKNKRDTVIDKSDDILTLNMGSSTTTVKQGDLTIKVELGKIYIEAMQSIEFKVGKSTILMEQSGITTKGIMFDMKATAKADLSSPLTTVKADGALTLSGGITKIN